MHDNTLASLARLSDAELLARIKALVARERDLTAEIVAHLAELETRDVYLRQGYPSLYVYCRDALGLSEWEAYNRIEVARAARQFPVILELLEEGSVNLTAVKMLAPHLTSQNHRDVFAAARGKKKSEIEELVAKLSPKPDAPSSVRRVPDKTAGSRPPADSDASMSSAAVLGAAALADVPLTPPAASTSSAVPAASTVAAAAAVTPLSPGRYKLQVTIGGDTLEKIRLAKDMLGHAIPSGDDAAIMDRAFTALLAELARKKFADASRPGTSARDQRGALDAPPAMRERLPRGPSAAVKRAVWLRDLGRCAFVGSGGHRCNERRFVEFHHVDPYALGGEATVDGIQLRCRRHNNYEGRLYFGERRAARGGELVPEQVGLSVTRSSS